MAVQYVEPGSTTLGTPTGDDDIILLGGSAQIVTNLDWSSVTQAAIVEVGRNARDPGHLGDEVAGRADADGYGFGVGLAQFPLHPAGCGLCGLGIH